MCNPLYILFVGYVGEFRQMQTQFETMIFLYLCVNPIFMQKNKKAVEKLLFLVAGAGNDILQTTQLQRFFETKIS